MKSGCSSVFQMSANHMSSSYSSYLCTCQTKPPCTELVLQRRPPKQIHFSGSNPHLISLQVLALGLFWWTFLWASDGLQVLNCLEVTGHTSLTGKYSSALQGPRVFIWHLRHVPTTRKTCIYIYINMYNICRYIYILYFLIYSIIVFHCASLTVSQYLVPDGQWWKMQRWWANLPSRVQGSMQWNSDGTGLYIPRHPFYEFIFRQSKSS